MTAIERLKRWERDAVLGKKVPYLVLSGPQSSGKTHWIQSFLERHRLSSVELDSSVFQWWANRDVVLVHEPEKFKAEWYNEPTIQLSRMLLGPRTLINNIVWIQEEGPVPDGVRNFLVVDMIDIYPYCWEHGSVRKVCKACVRRSKRGR